MANGHVCLLRPQKSGLNYKIVFILFKVGYKYTRGRIEK